MTPAPHGVFATIPMPGWHRAVIFLLFFLSGFTGLVYEVLWLKELAVVFGSTSQAAAVTLSVFFLGLAVGGDYWGRRAPRARSALATYGWLEVGVAGSAVLYFGLRQLYYAIYSPLYAVAGASPLLLAGAKAVLAAGILCPPAFFMGGTLPLMGQHLVRRPEMLGRVGSFLYALNTAGAALGVFGAGFFLPLSLGFRNTYLLAIAGSLSIGVAALWLGRPREGADEARPASGARRRPDRPQADLAEVTLAGAAGLAFASGALTLALEVLWTRTFVQVLQNSVYTFSIILVIFLVALTLGAALANALCRLRGRARPRLSILLSLAGLAVALTPALFSDVTDDFGYLAQGEGWLGYVASIFLAAALVVLPSGVLIGAVFPYLLRVVQIRHSSPGAVIGRLMAINTAGAILGSLAAGFLLLGTLGLWGSYRLVAVAYLVLGFVMVDSRSRSRAALRVVPLVGIVLAFTVLAPSSVPPVRIDSERGERLLDVIEGTDAVVAVVERGTDRRLKVNNYYSLGGTASREHEENQALIPLMTHPKPDSVFLLGLGTGITAGAALSQPVRRLVVCELVPEIVEAARTYFADLTNGLFADPRVTLLTRDGRNHLLGTSEQYDVIIADLFIPWRAGVGGLYSREHFRAARRRLTSGGIYVQWLPLYQLSSREFATIARTLLDVFPQVVMWRGSFFPTKPIVALVGSDDLAPLDPELLVARGRLLANGEALPASGFKAVTLPFYAGNLGEARHLLPTGPINTEDRPVVEYLAPISHRNERTGESAWFTSLELSAFYEALADAVPPARDPYLARLDAEARDFVTAGLSYARAAALEHVGRREEAETLYQDFFTKIPFEYRPSTDASNVYTDFPP